MIINIPYYKKWLTGLKIALNIVMILYVFIKLCLHLYVIKVRTFALLKETKLITF